MSKRRWILWQGLIAPSMERLIAAAAQSGFELNGLILQGHQDAPYAVRYRLRVDHDWRSRDLEIEVENGGRHNLRLASDGAGGWSRTDGPLSELDGCIDLDVEWSPSTNTLPIRRLGLTVGESRAVTAAWIRCPTLAVERLDQTYERVDVHRYRYRAGAFTADLTVDDDGLVLRYGANWKAVATSGEL
jgi:hypothetical protein